MLLEIKNSSSGNTINFNNVLHTRQNLGRQVKETNGNTINFNNVLHTRKNLGRQVKETKTCF